MDRFDAGFQTVMSKVAVSQRLLTALGVGGGALLGGGAGLGAAAGVNAMGYAAGGAMQGEGTESSFSQRHPMLSNPGYALGRSHRRMGNLGVEVPQEQWANRHPNLSGPTAGTALEANEETIKRQAGKKK